MWRTAPRPAARAGAAFAVMAEPASMSRLGGRDFGPLQWRGGLRLRADDPRFGGFSGLILGRDGRRLLAVSDHGYWWRARLAYDDRGHLSGLASSGVMAHVLSSRATPLGGKWRDAEALAPYDARYLSGPVLTGFERKERLALYNWGGRGARAPARYIPLPPGVSLGKNNGELEAAARFWAGPRKGWFIAAGEKNFDARGNVRAWLWKGKTILPFSITRLGHFRVTDMAVLPDGKGFITLERRFSKKLKVLPAFALRLFRTADIERGRTVPGRLLLKAGWPAYAIDNMEGLSIHRHDGGELRLTIISDDNYNRALQSTLLFQFALSEKALAGL